MTQKSSFVTMIGSGKPGRRRCRSKRAADGGMAAVTDKVEWTAEGGTKARIPLPRTENCPARVTA